MHATAIADVAQASVQPRMIFCFFWPRIHLVQEGPRLFLLIASRGRGSDSLFATGVLLIFSFFRNQTYITLTFLKFTFQILQ